MKHLDECEYVKAVDHMAELHKRFPSEEPPPPVGDEVYFVNCHPDCPVLASLITRGRELAKEHGW